MICPSCSAEAPADARFCPTCGHALNAPPDERRVVTVLFGDLVGFTGLAETRDPEQVKNLVDRAFAALAEDIRSFGGSLDKVVGDALVALFGAPVAHEDDAERAVRAALQMQATLAELSHPFGVEVKMRIGVNTGEVLVGGLRVGGDYTAMGDVVNTASRLETLAEPGCVVVGPDTYAATAGVFRYEPLGHVHARGREASVEAWIAREALQQPGGRPLRRVSTRLVGRDAEAELLEGVFLNAFAHRRPTLAVLLGEAGMGKSRLGEEVVLRVVASQQARVLSGRSVPYGATNAWWPIAEVMRSACGVTPEDGADMVREKCRRTVAAALGPDVGTGEVERVVEALLYLIGVSGSLADVEGRRAKDEVSRAVRSLLEGLASERPLVITIADVQWADPTVLLGLDDLLQRINRVPMVVLLTARPEIEEHWRPSAVRQNLIVLNLDPLDDQAITELLISLLGHDPGAEVRAELVERSGGNPLFVEELAGLLAERAAGDGSGVGVLPATLRGIVAARLDALPPGERAVLDDAAVVGRRAPIATLLSLGGSRGGVADAVEQLVSKDLLVVDDGQVEFRSDLVREVVYGMLTKAERARRHATMARWLEEEAVGGPAEDELLGELARHWTTAAELWAELGGVEGVPPDVQAHAIAALERAGTRAEDRELHVVAFRIFDRMVRLLDDEALAVRRHALVGRARAATALRRDAIAEADLDVVEAEARAEGDEVALARALTVRGDLLRNAGDYEGSLVALGEARQLWQGVGDRRGEGSALRRIGWTKLFAGDLEGAEPVLLEALEAFREANAPRGQAWAHQNLAWAAYGRGDTALAEQRLADSIELFRKIGDWGGLNWTTGMLGWVRLTQGLVAEAELHAGHALAEARDQGDVWQQGMMTILLGSIRLWQGRIDEAIERCEEATRLFTDIGDGWGLVQVFGPKTRALVLAGRFEEAKRLAAEVASRTETDPTLDRYRMFPLMGSAAAAVAAGGPSTALAILDDGLPEPSGPSFGTNELVVTRALALVQLGQAAEAVELLSDAVEGATSPGPRSQALAALALALAADGRAEDARKAAAEVAAIDGSYLDRAIAAAADGCAAARLGDRAAAREVLDRAARIVAGTQDRLTAAVVAVARARVLEALDDPFAGGAEADARQQLDTLGIEAIGWDRAFRLAVGG